MLPAKDQRRFTLSKTDFNDIFHDLQRNMKRILSHYKAGSNKFNKYALQLMDEMCLCTNDKRKSAMLMNTLNELLNSQDGHQTQILAKKELDNNLGIQLEGLKGGMSFGGHQQKQDQEDHNQQKQQAVDNDFTSSPVHKSVMELLVQEPQQGKKEGVKSHPVNHSKSHGRQSKWAGIKQLDDKINEANMYIEPLPKQPITNVPLEQMVKSVKKMVIDVERSAEEDKDVQYDLTDYSSNESSNDAVYNYEYRDEEDQNLNMISLDHKFQSCENLFTGNAPCSSQTQSIIFDFKKFENLKKSNSTMSSLVQPTLKPNSIMKSAFKPFIQRKKRLYCRNKRIPFWAEDLSKVTQFNKGKDPDQIFGRCIVENLNVEYLFPNKMTDHSRTSSAKWSRDAMMQ